jgi:hypothetical protein
MAESDGMRTRHFYNIIFIILFLAGCNSIIEPSVEKGVSINIPFNSDGRVDLDELFVEAKDIIYTRLPNAEYGATLLKVPCDDLSLSKGKITFLFKDRRKTWLGLKEQILFAYVVIDVGTGSLDLSITDQTDHYPSLLKYEEVSSRDFYDVLSAIKNHLDRNDFENCSIAVSQMDDYWDISVISNETSEYLDIFGIKSDNKQVIDDPIVR